MPDETLSPPAEAPATPETPAAAAPRPRRKYKRRHPKHAKAAATRVANNEAVRAQEEQLRAAGLLGADLPEAEALKDAPEDIKARLTRQEKDKLSLAEALAREAEIDSNDDGSRHGAGNEFAFDLSIVPAGWHYEWKRDTVLNERSPAYFTALAKSGWRAVPRDRHPDMMPGDWPGETIMRGGLILMQIPKNVVERRRQEDTDIANAEVQNKLAQLNGRSQKDRPGAQPRRGQATREFGPIAQSNETLYGGQIVGGHVVPGGRSIAR